MNNIWRIIETEPLDAYENMALDEALFISFCNASLAIPIFRIYQWKLPAFSIGASQDSGSELDLEKCRIRGIACVRRMTGGGIIFHDSEITYSLVIPKAFPGIENGISESFKKLCEFLMIFYRKLGFKPSFAIDEPYGGLIGQPAQFCFAAREKYDIVIDKKKIGGNAQKRSRAAIFQHGSIPLFIDRKHIAQFTIANCEKELARVTALNELNDTIVSRKELITLLKRSFIEAWGVLDSADVLTKDELVLADKLKKEKYLNDAWNIKRVTNALLSEKAGMA